MRIALGRAGQYRIVGCEAWRADEPTQPKTYKEAAGSVAQTSLLSQGEWQGAQRSCDESGKDVQARSAHVLGALPVNQLAQNHHAVMGRAGHNALALSQGQHVADPAGCDSVSQRHPPGFRVDAGSRDAGM